MNNRLSIFERIFLTWQAFRDVKKNAFFVASIASPYEQIDSVGNSPKSSGAMQLPVSYFVQRELDKLKIDIRYIFSRRPTLYWTPNNNLWHIYVWSAFGTILNVIEDHRLRLTAEIHTDNKEFVRIRDELDAAKKRYEAQKEPHWVQLRINQYNQARADYVKNTVSKYKTVIALLNEKINLIAAANDRLEYTCARRFHRIRFYYTQAAAFSKKLAIILPSDETLAALANIKLGEVYVQERMKALDLLNKYMAQISQY